MVRGKFLAINAASMSCACPRSPKGLSPSAHLADGTTDLILVRRCSRLDFLKHLLRHTNKDDQVRSNKSLSRLFQNKMKTTVHLTTWLPFFKRQQLFKKQIPWTRPPPSSFLPPPVSSFLPSFPQRQGLVLSIQSCSICALMN